MREFLQISTNQYCCNAYTEGIPLGELSQKYSSGIYSGNSGQMFSYVFYAGKHKMTKVNEGLLNAIKTQIVMSYVRC